MHCVSRVVFTAVLISGLTVLGSTAGAGVVHIHFDDLNSGSLTGTHYLGQGVMFFDSNGSKGTSTAIRLENNLPVTARVGNFSTSVSAPNVLVPDLGVNRDIWIQFYDALANRTTASFLQVQNDAEGFPTIALEAFDRQGTLLERTALVGARQFATVMQPGMFLVKVVANPSTLGNLAVDNLSFELESATVPEPSAVMGVGLAVGCGLAWRSVQRRRTAP